MKRVKYELRQALLSDQQEEAAPVFSIVERKKKCLLVL